jgi:tight adherence protein C
VGARRDLSMADLPLIVILGAALGLFCLGIAGSRGLLEIRDALRAAEFDRLAVLDGWLAARGLASVVAAIPVMAVLMSATSTAGLAWVVSALAAGIVFWFAPQILLAARRRVERRVLDDLALHLDLIALAFEAGCGWTAALMSCTERTPDGPLRRAWARVIVEIQAGVEPLEALRGLEQRSRLRPFTTLLSAVRAAEKLQQPLAPVLRERARSAAAAKFARAERDARAAPLRLWAAMCLCLLPCTAVVLAFPVANLLARVWS